MTGELPTLEDLYGQGEDRRVALHAAHVEAEGYCRWTRVRELAEFAIRVGVRRLGLGHCADMNREAGLAARYLAGRDLDAVLPPSSTRCSPVAQAEFFAAQGTRLNVVAGMSVAHEALFVGASAVPVVALVARDARLRHNPVAALYTSESYSKTRLFPGGERTTIPAFRGRDEEVLARVSEELDASDTDDLNRVQEAMEFARRLGARKIGISFCVGFREEARVLTRILEANGFLVSSVCCKAGAVPKEELGVTDPHKVRPGQREMICNPLLQAELLNRAGVELALSLGQCVGHDSATLERLEGPAICLVAKDRVLCHNTVAALYAMERPPPGPRSEIST
jgi:uncharacterized metal-binding protein